VWLPKDKPADHLDRIDSIEQKIGAGLIEEVIQVAEGELQLVDEMLRHQVYVWPRPRSLR
jgi:NADH dehydrogenase (ubiquinone) 1 alpha subcomplex subunit 5